VPRQCLRIFLADQHFGELDLFGVRQIDIAEEQQPPRIEELLQKGARVVIERRLGVEATDLRTERRSQIADF
jgi:hypothetical protein